MFSSSSTLISILLYASIFNTARCDTIDYCDGDPRIRTITHDCPGQKHIIHMRRTFGNPNHALHDYLWALSYYLNNCARGQVLLSLPDPPVKDVSQCTNRTNDHRWISPYWSICVISSMMDKLGPKYSYSFKQLDDSEDQNVTECYRTETYFGVLPKNNGFYGRHMADHFRILNYYGRNITEKPMKSYGQMWLRPLPYALKVQAFQFIKDAVYEKYGISPERRGTFWNESAGDGKIRVLVYNRKNVVRRRWVNAEVVTRHLDKIKDVSYKFFESIPRPFGQQVDLFSWADIIIAPHGAAMVNTMFMKRGADIIEVWKFCLHNVATGPRKPREWTGWHAELFGLNLTYVQSHISQLPFKKPEELFSTQGPETNGTHKVREEEILAVFHEALERQRHIMRDVKEAKMKSSVGLLKIWNTADHRKVIMYHVWNTVRITFMLAAFLSVVINLRRMQRRVLPKNH